MAHLSLFDLNALIKKTLDQHLEVSYWVIAEIGEMRLNQKGHCYMELVEKEGNFITAKIKANIWAYTYRNISSWFESITKTPLQSGLKVLLSVSVQFHEVYGLSLNVKDIDPNFTLGERARKRQEVIQRLVDEGVYEMNKSLSLPMVPQKVAIISSETAAGYGDFMNHLTANDRGLTFHTRLFPATMQGDQAAQSIIKALHDIHSEIEQYDLVTIIRGGGGQLDLDCFDEYELAAHVAQFPIPVITGIGHERDETITDLVAHTEMKTPTAVADFLISGLMRFDDLLNESIWRIHQSATREISDSKIKLGQTLANLRFSANKLLQVSQNQLNRKCDELSYRITDAIKGHDQRLERLKRNLLDKSSFYLIQQKESLANFERHLKLIEPSAVMKRGYSISKVNGKLLKDTKLNAGDKIITHYSNGKISSTIEDVDHG